MLRTQTSEGRIRWRGKSLNRNLATKNDPAGSFFVAPVGRGSAFFHGFRSAEALFHRETQTFRMAVELRGIQALDFGDASLVLAAKLDAGGIFEDIRALRQIIDEVMVRRVARGFVV